MVHDALLPAAWLLFGAQVMLILAIFLGSRQETTLSMGPTCILSGSQYWTKDTEYSEA